MFHLESSNSPLYTPRITNSSKGIPLLPKNTTGLGSIPRIPTRIELDTCAFIKVANRKESSGEYFRFPAGEITDGGVPGQQDQPPSIPTEVSDFPLSREMSAMVTALTHVVSGESYGGETAAFYQMGWFNQSLNSPSSTTYSSSSSGQKRGREEECVVSQVGEQQFPFQRVYRGFGGGGDSSSSITSVVQLSDDESTVETVIKNESNVLVEEQNNVAVTSLERAHRAERKQRTETSFSYVDIEQHFGKKQEDAAESLKVSRSTLKRECRKHGIKRWPFPKRKKLNHFSTSKFKHVNEPLRSGTEGLPKSNNYKISQDIMLEPLPNGREMVQQQSFEQLTVETIINSGSLVSGAKQNDVVTYLEKQNGEETSDIEYRTTDVSLSREELKRHFGKKIDDAAKTFGVSRSTMKRACRVNGIKRWPFPKRKKFNPSPSNLKHVNRFVRLGAEQIPEFGICEPLCSDPPPMNATANVAQTITNATPKQDVRTVTIKATYGVEIIRFQLSFSSRKEDLIEKVTKRLPLKDGTFNIKYEDDDGDWVLIACDEDLEECIGISKGKSAIKMSIQPITNQAP